MDRVLFSTKSLAGDVHGMGKTRTLCYVIEMFNAHMWSQHLKKREQGFAGRLHKL